MLQRRRYPDQQNLEWLKRSISFEQTLILFIFSLQGAKLFHSFSVHFLHLSIFKGIFFPFFVRTKLLTLCLGNL